MTEKEELEDEVVQIKGFGGKQEGGGRPKGHWVGMHPSNTLYSKYFRRDGTPKKRRR